MNLSIIAYAYPTHNLAKICYIPDGFLMLEEGAAVEYDLGHQADGRSRAIEVTQPGGAPVVPLPREHREDYNSQW